MSFSELLSVMNSEEDEEGKAGAEPRTIEGIEASPNESKFELGTLEPSALLLHQLPTSGTTAPCPSRGN